jgi:hypothetical protein
MAFDEPSAAPTFVRDVLEDDGVRCSRAANSASVSGRIPTYFRMASGMVACPFLVTRTVPSSVTLTGKSSTDRKKREWRWCGPIRGLLKMAEGAF